MAGSAKGVNSLPVKAIRIHDGRGGEVSRMGTATANRAVAAAGVGCGSPTNGTGAAAAARSPTAASPSFNHHHHNNGGGNGGIGNGCGGHGGSCHGSVGGGLKLGLSPAVSLSGTSVFGGRPMGSQEESLAENVWRYMRMPHDRLLTIHGASVYSVGPDVLSFACCPVRHFKLLLTDLFKL